MPARLDVPVLDANVAPLRRSRIAAAASAVSASTAAIDSSSRWPCRTGEHVREVADVPGESVEFRAAGPVRTSARRGPGDSVTGTDVHPTAGGGDNAGRVQTGPRPPAQGRRRSTADPPGRDHITDFAADRSPSAGCGRLAGHCAWPVPGRLDECWPWGTGAAGLPGVDGERECSRADRGCLAGYSVARAGRRRARTARRWALAVAFSVDRRGVVAVPAIVQPARRLEVSRLVRAGCGTQATPGRTRCSRTRPTMPDRGDAPGPGTRGRWANATRSCIPCRRPPGSAGEGSGAGRWTGSTRGSDGRESATCRSLSCWGTARPSDSTGAGSAPRRSHVVSLRLTGVMSRSMPYEVARWDPPMTAVTARVRRPDVRQDAG